MARLGQKLEEVVARIGRRVPGDPVPILATASPGLLALSAMNRLLTGRDYDQTDGGEDSEDVDGEDAEGAEGDSDMEQPSDDEDEENDDEEASDEGNLSNPLMFRNVMLRRSGSLPHLARALSETFGSIVRSVEKCHPKAGDHIETPLHYLQRRASSLFAIVDGACCLSRKNRTILCEEHGCSGTLISNILRLITAVPLQLETSSVVISDVALSALRALTSLSHENPTAAEQMLPPQGIGWQKSIIRKRKNGKLQLASSGQFVQLDRASGLSGIAIIVHKLHEMALAQQQVRKAKSAGNPQVDDSLEKHCYDVVIFCLNTLTNVVEMASFTGARQKIANLKLEVDGKKISALSWVASWLTDQTTSYRDAMMTGSFGEGDSARGNSFTPEEANEHRDLEKHEEEYLVTAGNGFILLACLMKPIEEGPNVDEDTSKIRQTILSEMPMDARGRRIGVTLIIKTLKAFCNFYHYSIGDLSVAIVAPVLKLIRGLESIHIPE